MKHLKHRHAPLFDQATARTATAMAASLLCSMMSNAHAQAEAGQNTESASLTTITVTANKREQAAIDVPASVTAISAERLALGGATRLEDYAAQVPGMALTAQTRGQTVVTLRGIGTGSNQAMPTTAQYIDDAPIGSINAFAAGSKVTPDLDPYDLRRVEVLKGPQGTSYGAGAVGGVVRYVTIPANTKRFSGAVSVGANQVSDGGHGSSVRAALNIPLLADTLGLRVSAFDRTEAGYIDNPFNGKTDVNKARIKGGRIALDWQVADGWSLRAWALTQQFSADGMGMEDVLAPSLALYGKPLQRATYVDEVQDIRLNVSNVALRGRIGNFDVVSSSTYQTSDLMRVNDNTPGTTRTLQLLTGLPGLGAYTVGNIDTRRVTQEFRARSTAFGERLEYELGLFYTKEDNLLDSQLPPPFRYASGAVLPLPKLGDGSIASSYREYSLFGNLSYALTPQVSLLAGLRRANDDQHFDLDYKASALSPAPVKLLQDVSHGKTTYMGGVNYKIHADTAVYARVATGYRPGGPSALPPGVLANGKISFDPDDLTSYELGFKSAFLGNKASIEAALFHTNWKNMQLMASAPAKPPQTYIPFNYGTNGGTARSSGAEATLLLSPLDNVTIRASGAYTDTRLTSAAPAVGGLDGDAMPYVPKWGGSLSADYRYTLGAAKAYVGGTVSRVGERMSDYSKNMPVMLPGYTTLMLNAGLNWSKVRVNVYAKNLTNARGVNFLGQSNATPVTSNPAAYLYTAAIIQPRTIGIDLSYLF
ncbi:TonB-dependent receptor [Janthinobacterium sp. HH01]|uniref:TonB-dependent receptor n=1 Tax=Janthinobacterium sp. HH01 TaxID=1198452 RepID=UPI0002AEA7E3|nr:TonB-dependent receptor [Janthinobacterium sp. HH01]ELX09248.1 TonB-dependent receptor [Janthinobacterium sp. HH01]